MGAVAEFKLSETISVQPEVLYSTQGVKSKELGFDADIKLDYITVPFMLKFYLVNGFNLEIGPQLGFLTSAKVELEESVEFDVKDSLKNVDVGANLGLGYKFSNGFIVGARYSLGLININDEEELEEFGLFNLDNYKLHNGVFQLSMGFKF